MTDKTERLSGERLEPCPFCNAPMEQHPKYPPEYRHAYISGERCPAGGATIYIDDAPAVAAWNRRAASPVQADVETLKAEVERLQKAMNTPELHDFSAGVVAEAQHQRERWGVDGDAGKTAADWFWLVGYLAGKALTAANTENTDKALHHCVSTAAALANWHATLGGMHSRMRPGIDGEATLFTSPPVQGEKS